MASDARLETFLDVLVTRIADAVADRLTPRVQPSGTSVPDGLLDEPTMAERIHVSQQSLQRRRKAGIVPFVSCGRRVLYRPEDVIAALKSQETGGAK